MAFDLDAATEFASDSGLSAEGAGGEDVEAGDSEDEADEAAARGHDVGVVEPEIVAGVGEGEEAADDGPVITIGTGSLAVNQAAA